MLDSVVGFMTILSKSTDQILQEADFMNNIVVPIFIGITILGAVLSIFGKKDK